MKHGKDDTVTKSVVVAEPYATATVTDEAGNMVYLPPVSAPKTGRDASGRFLPGAPSANPYGRPPKNTEQAYMQAAWNAVSPEQFGEATKKIFDHILNTGSIRAYAVLADRLGGKPTQRIHVSDAATPDDWLQAMLDEAGTGDSEAK